MNVDTEVAARPAVRGPSAGAVTLTVNHNPRLRRVDGACSLAPDCPADWPLR
jgi:hypothetical protein